MHLDNNSTLLYSYLSCSTYTIDIVELSIRNISIEMIIFTIHVHNIYIQLYNNNNNNYYIYI